MTTQEKNNEMLAVFVPEFMDKKNVHRLCWKDCPFHSSPEWLLPVWYKFRDSDWPHPYPISAIQYHFQEIERAFMRGTFTDLYDSLVNAVQWHNSINQKDNGSKF